MLLHVVVVNPFISIPYMAGAEHVEFSPDQVRAERQGRGWGGGEGGEGKGKYGEKKV